MVIEFEFIFEALIENEIKFDLDQYSEKSGKPY